MTPEISNSAETDISFMRKALELAQKAADAGEVPIGAIAVLNGTIIGSSGNRVEEKKSAIAHAEILAIRKACKKLNAWRFDMILRILKKQK